MGGKCSKGLLFSENMAVPWVRGLERGAGGVRCGPTLQQPPFLLCFSEGGMHLVCALHCGGPR